MPQRKPKKVRAGDLIAKIRKPMAPPSRTIEDPTKYKRERELERLRREEKSGNSLMAAPVRGQVRVGIIGAGLIGQIAFDDAALGRRSHRAKRARGLDRRRVASGGRAPRRAMAGRAGARVGRRNNRRPVDRCGLDLHADRDASPDLYCRRARRQAYLLREAARDDRGRSAEMAAAIKASGVVSQVGLVLRFSPVYNVIKAMFEERGRRPTAQRHDARRPGLSDPRLRTRAHGATIRR